MRTPAAGRLGRRPTPTHLRLLQGNPQRRPIPNEPRPEMVAVVPDPPEHIYGYALAEWRRASKVLMDLRLLTVADLKMFEAYCLAYARWREAEDGLAHARAADPINKGLTVINARGGTSENPLIGTSRRACFEMMRYAAEFGFSPASRARVHRPPDNAPADPFRGVI